MTRKDFMSMSFNDLIGIIEGLQDEIDRKDAEIKALKQAKDKPKSKAKVKPEKDLANDTEHKSVLGKVYKTQDSFEQARKKHKLTSYTWGTFQQWSKAGYRIIKGSKAVAVELDNGKVYKCFNGDKVEIAEKVSA